MMPTASNAQPSNHIGVQQPPNQNPKFDDQCRHCGIQGYKCAECRKRHREQNTTKPANQNQQQTTISKPRPQTEVQRQYRMANKREGTLLYFKNPTTSAYRNVPYAKQSTDEHKQCRNDFRQANNITYTQTKCPTRTPQRTRQTMLRRRSDPKTWNFQKSSGATSSSSKTHMCATEQRLTNRNSTERLH